MNKKTIIKRAFVFMTILMLVFSYAFSFGSYAANEENGVLVKLNSLKSKYPDGKHWNHLVDNPDFGESVANDVTSHACYSHNDVARTGKYYCNYFDGGFQCYGFARKVFYDIFGQRVSQLPIVTANKNISIGDYVRLYSNNDSGHSGVVLSISGNTFTLSECNVIGNPCVIRWGGATYYKDDIVGYVHATNYDAVKALYANGVTGYTNVSDGKYYVKNRATGKYLNPNGTTIDSTVSVAAFSDEIKQIFEIKKSNGSYLITAGFNEDLRLNPNSDKLSSLDRVNLFISDYESANDQHWSFEPRSGGYVIHNMKAESLVLGLYSNTSTVDIESYTGDSDQIWDLVPVSSSSAWSFDWTKWSQGASSDYLMRNYGCWVVAQAKLLKATGIVTSTDFNPDVYKEWEQTNGYLDDGFYQTNGGEAPVAYASKLGKTLRYIGAKSATIANIISGINQDYYMIIKMTLGDGSQHYVLIDNSKTLSTGNVYVYQSYTNTTTADSALLSTALTWNTLYCYSVKDSADPLTFERETSYNVRESIGNTNATVVHKISLNQGYTASSLTVGIEFMDSEGQLLAINEETLNLSGYSYGYVWCDVNQELKLTLKQGTEYNYRFFAVYSGKKYYGDINSFRTAGYSVSYNANDGAGAPSVQYANENSTVTLSGTVPTRTGYDFLGWSENKYDLTATYKPGERVSFTKNVMLYAVWSQKTYKIEYDANGGINAPATQTKTYGTEIKISSHIPERSMYKFLGWATDSTAATPKYRSGDTYTANSNLKLYAVWEKVVLSSVSIVNLPVKTEYEINEKLDTVGLIIRLNYSDGSSETVTSGYTVSGFDSAVAGVKNITVTYDGKTASFNAYVNEAKITSISIGKNPTKTVYTVGEALNTDGMILNVKYSDGSIKTVTSGFSTTGFDSSSAGKKNVTVNYNGFTASFSVTVSFAPAVTTTEKQEDPEVTVPSTEPIITKPITEPAVDPTTTEPATKPTTEPVTDPATQPVTTTPATIADTEPDTNTTTAPSNEVDIKISMGGCSGSVSAVGGVLAFLIVTLGAFAVSKKQKYEE